MWQQNRNTSALNSRRHQEASASNHSGWKTELTGAWNDWVKGGVGEQEEVKSGGLGEEPGRPHCWIRRSDCTWKD